MKKLLLLAAVMGLGTINTALFAQEEKVEIIEKKEKKEKKERKETQEIVIRKNGNNDIKVTVEINGDDITINGKPLSEFKDGDITINKRRIIMTDDVNNLSVFPRGYVTVRDNPSYSKSLGKKGAYLGVTPKGNDDDDKKAGGAIVESVAEKSPAEKIGLKEGDVITGVNDVKVTDHESLLKAVTSFNPKDEVTVYYKRDEKNKSSKVILGEVIRFTSMVYSSTMPRTLTAPRLDDLQNTYNWKLNRNIDGIQLLDNNNFPRQQKLGLKIQDTEEGNGVKVLDVDKESPAEKAGLKKDDIVTEIGGKKITNTDEAREQLMENADKSAYNVKAKRNGSDMNFDIKIPKKLKTANL